MRQRTRQLPAKGTSRRVVIVPGEEDGVFEQIICVVRDDAVSRQGVSAEEVLRQARALLRGESAEDAERESAIFSGPVLILALIALALTAALLLILWAKGWL